MQASVPIFRLPSQKDQLRGIILTDLILVTTRGSQRCRFAAAHRYDFVGGDGHTGLAGDGIDRRRRTVKVQLPPERRLPQFMAAWNHGLA